MDNESLRSEGSFVTLSGHNNGLTDQDKTDHFQIEFQDTPQRNEKEKDASFIDMLRERRLNPNRNRGRKFS